MLSDRDSGPVCFIDEKGVPVSADAPRGLDLPRAEVLTEAYRRMVVGRRFDQEATALTRQGRLAVYPSARGQEACQVGSVLVLRETDWLFPTYRDTMALVVRGVDVTEALGLLRGEWHCGYDPSAVRVAPQCTPLGTHLPHAAGLAWAARRRGEDTVALAFVGDGGTSEGDFHEALNFAAVFRAPVVFVVQNNRYAISVPLSRQTRAPSLAAKAAGYGVRGVRVDGNDAAAVVAVLDDAVERARRTSEPVLVEAETYRLEAHTNADDDRRYRDPDEVRAWARRDPVARLEAYLRGRGVLTDDDVAAVEEEAEAFARHTRERLSTEPRVDPDELFAHVYDEPVPRLAGQRALVAGRAGSR